MWKPEHRQAAERHGLRYPSDLTDAEWALVAPMVPPARHGGRPRDVNVREVLNAICYVLSTGCQWQALPKDLPPKSTRTITSCCGTGMARWRASTTRSTSRPASRPDAKRARLRRSSTVRVPRRLKKGLCARPAGFRCRQEGHRTQAPYPRRHARVAVERGRSPRRRAGSRWRPPSAAHGAPLVSVHRMHLCGCRISRAEDGKGHRRYRVLERCRSSSAPMPTPSSSCPSDGLSSARSHGSAATAVWHAISSATPEPPPPSSALP